MTGQSRQSTATKYRPIAYSACPVTFLNLRLSSGWPITQDMPRESADNLVQTVAAASSSSRESRSGSPTATSRRRGGYLKRTRCRPHCTRSKGTTTAASSANKGLWSCSILSTNVCRYPRPSLTHRLGGRLHQRRGGTPTRVLVPKKIRHVRPGNRRWSRGGCLTARQSIGPPCPILHLAGDSHARCSPAARHRLDIRDELGNGTEGGRWGPHLPGQPASPLDPHTLVWTALAN